jgi:signal transduction histidine kinase
MSKETAHQLGTPTSSLAGWAELIKMDSPNSKIADELARDVARLEKITDRFSKIGSRPELKKEKLLGIINSNLDYLRTRSSSKVEFEVSHLNYSDQELPVNASLFEWVLENIFKNAIDAMQGEGKVIIGISESSHVVNIDIEDTGKGIPKSASKHIFKPGYTTKARGWGLGLSLSKRIIETYHDGRIFLKYSEPGKGSCIRIILKKS